MVETPPWMLAAALNYKCPLCSAKKDNPCIDVRRKERTELMRPHPSRIEMVRKYG